MDEDRLRTATHDSRECSDRRGSEVLLSLTVDEPGRHAIRQKLTATTRVRASQWEVEAAGSLRQDRGDVFRATECLLGLPEFDPPSISIERGVATVVVERHGFGRCIGPFEVTAGNRKLAVSVTESTAGTCGSTTVDGDRVGPLGSHEVKLTVELRTPGRQPFVSPAPALLQNGVARWTREPGATPLAVHAELPTGKLEQIAWTVEGWSPVGASVGPDRVDVDVLSLLSRLPELLLVLLLTVAAWSRDVSRATVVAVVLVAAEIVSIDPDGWAYDAARAVVVGVGLAAAALWSSISRRPRVLAALAALAGAALSWQRSDFESPLLGGAVLAALVPAAIVVVVGLARRLRAPIPRGRSDVVPWPALGSALTVAVVSGVAYTVGQAIGLALGEDDSRFYLDTAALTYAASAFALLAVMTCAAAALNTLPDSPVMSNRATLVAVTVWAGLALRRPVEVASIPLPLAPLVSLGVLYLLLRVRQKDPAPDAAERGTLRHLRAALPAAATPIGTPASWRVSARRAAEVGAVLAVLPVGYFLWTALTDLPARTYYGPGFASLIAGALYEAGRWLATAWLFGAAYTRLPGRSGPGKASVIWVAWFFGAGVSEVASRWVSEGSGREWAFPGFQLILFLFIVGVVLDVLTLTADGKSASDLLAVYGIQRLRGATTYVVPVALAVIGIAQQVAEGSGTDFVKGVLDAMRAL